MDWKSSADKFLEKKKSDLSFCEFFHNTLGFDKKDSADKWKALSQNLKKWNKKYLLQYETISLYSPVVWTLNISINCFCIPENEAHIEDWLHWTCFSAYINDCVSDGLILRIKENRLNALEFFMKTQEEVLGFDAEQFLVKFDREYFFENYIWIDTETFLMELAQKRKRSYQRLIANEKERKEYIQNMLPEYEKYQKYEALFQNSRQNKTVLEIAEINPRRMEDLFDDCMWYLVKMENQVYIFSLWDYA